MTNIWVSAFIKENTESLNLWADRRKWELREKITKLDINIVTDELELHWKMQSSVFLGLRLQKSSSHTVYYRVWQVR